MPFNTKLKQTSTRLTPELIEPFCQLRASIFEWPADELTQRQLKLAHQLETNKTLSKRIQVAINKHQFALASAMAFPFEGKPWQAIFSWATQVDAASVLVALEQVVQNWLADLATLPQPPETLTTRLDLARAPEGLDDVMRKLGWQYKCARREFKAHVSTLPTEEQSPLTWKPLNEVGLTLAAKIVDEAGRGPEWEQGDTGEGIITHCFDNDELTCTPDCLEIGFFNDQPVAFVIAQSAPDGWCTISFMGVVPEARGQGLGKWVHRRGFELFRRQGATLYHGGTSSTNDIMLALFHQHNCVPYAHLAEWSYSTGH